eukprot:Rmarinus@m.1652
MEKVAVPIYIHKFFKQLHEYYVNHVFCDLTIVVDEEEYPCHKLVVATASPFLKEMLSAKPDVNVLDLDAGEYNFSGDCLNVVLNYMYSGELYISPSTNVIKLAAMAQIFQMAALRDSCCKLATQILSPANVVWMLRVGAENNLEPVKRDALRVAAEYFETILSSEGFLRSPLYIVLELLRQTTVQVRNETLVLEAALRWLEFDRFQRCRHSVLVQLLPLVRYPFIPTETLETTFRLHIQSSGMLSCACSLVRSLMAEAAAVKQAFALNDPSLLGPDVDDLAPLRRECRVWADLGWNADTSVELPGLSADVGPDRIHSVAVIELSVDTVGPEQSHTSLASFTASTADRGRRRKILTGSNDGTLRVWCADTLALEETLNFHYGAIWEIHVLELPPLENVEPTPRIITAGHDKKMCSIVPVLSGEDVVEWKLESTVVSSRGVTALLPTKSHTIMCGYGGGAIATWRPVDTPPFVAPEEPEEPANPPQPEKKGRETPSKKNASPAPPPPTSTLVKNLQTVGTTWQWVLNSEDLEAHAGSGVRALECFAIGKRQRYASADTEGVLKIWTDRFICLHSVNAHTKPILSLVWTGQQLATCGLDGALYFWEEWESDDHAVGLDGDVKTDLRTVQTLVPPKPENPLSCMCLSSPLNSDATGGDKNAYATARKLLVGGWDGSIRAFNVGNGELKRTVVDEGSLVTKLGIVGSSLISAGWTEESGVSRLHVRSSQQGKL